MNKYRVGLWVAAAAAGLGVVMASQAGAAGNPVEDRQGLMKQMGQAMKDVGPLVSGATPYDAAKVKAAMTTLAGNADKLHKLYPDSSKDAPKTEALPKIWENKADFDKRLTELSKLANDANKATSSDTFKPAFMAIGGACKGCHDNYRAKKS
jgi:cytochrome c556